MSVEHDTPAAAHEATRPVAQAPLLAANPGAAPLMAPMSAAALLAHPNIQRRANAPVRQAALLQLQRTQGNRATRRLLQRMETAGSASTHQEFSLPAPAQAGDGPENPALQSVLGNLGPGRPLGTDTPAALQGQSPVPLDDVRIHDDPIGHQAADVLGSEAFALGNRIVLGAPDTTAHSRDWLVAHELAHTIQQHPQTHAGAASDLEGEADHFADQMTQPAAKATAPPQLSVAPASLAKKVISRTTQDLPGNLLLVVDVDDGDFVGGCVKQDVPHVGIKLIKKGVPKAGGNQVFNIHMGVMTDAQGRPCVFFYESVSGLCETKCFPSQEELNDAWDEITDWLKDLFQKVLNALAVVAIIALVAILLYLFVTVVLPALAGLVLVAA